MNNRYSKVDFDNLPDIQELELDNNNNSNSPPPLYPANRQNRHLGYPESNKNYSNTTRNGIKNTKVSSKYSYPAIRIRNDSTKQRTWNVVTL